MSSKADEHGLVKTLGFWQRAKLAQHSDTRTHWRMWGEDRFYIGRLGEEFAELIDAIARHESPERVWREAADVANFAAMLADRYEARTPDAAADGEQGE